jgi:type IV pilus assembly protein PilA
MIAGTLVVRRGFSPEYIEAAGPAPRVSPVLATFAVLGVLLLGPFGIGVLAAIAIPAYQDYTIRVQVTEGLNVAAPYKVAIAESVAQGQPLSALNSEQLQLPETGHWNYVRSIRVVSGIIEITYGGSANNLISGKTVLLVPAMADAGQTVAWACGHHGPPDGFSPATTKDLSEYTTVADKFLPMLGKAGG